MKKVKKIFLATDHAGFELKEEMKKFLVSQNFNVEDCGAFSFDVQDDYPDFIIPAAEKVAQNPDEFRGIIFGGSGQGEALAANKVKGIRAALYYGGDLEIIKLSRSHNNANMLSLGARFLSFQQAKEAVSLWLETDFEGGRHANRIRKINDYENVRFKKIETIEELAEIKAIVQKEENKRYGKNVDLSYIDQFQQKTKYHFVLHGNKPIGVVIFTDEGKNLFLEDLVILQEYQNQGYGITTLRLVEEIAKVENFEAIIFLAFPQVVSFYEKHGYQKNFWEGLPEYPQLNPMGKNL